MPLVRYHIRNEYEHANPKLYSSADKDDPEGLIEGVAIAGLVGIIRQLGDLAEFAAEIFNILHEEVLATASKGQELVSRVQQLEAELPSIEKEILYHPNHAILAYNPGVEWHATIPYDQNHFANGDLPPFIRNSYKQCRSPPRLYVLDKFDVAGAGACFRRYSDPSLFKTEWAITEISRAEKEQEAKQSRNVQKKEQQTEKSELNAGIRKRMPNTAPDAHQASTSQQPQKNAVSVSQNEKHLPRGETLSSKQGQQSNNGSNPTIAEPEISPRIDVPCIKSSQPVCNPSNLETSDSLRQRPEHLRPIVANSNTTTENEADAISETESFVDALATMESETETDSEIRSTVRVYREITSESNISPTGKAERCDVTEEGNLSCHDAAEKYEKVKPVAPVIIKDTQEQKPMPPDSNATKGRTHEKPESADNVHVLMKERISNAGTSKKRWVDQTEHCNSPTLINRNGGSSSWIAEAPASRPTTYQTCKQVDSDSDTNSDSPGSRVMVKPNDMPDRMFSESETEKNSPDDSTSESTGRISPRTSADSLIIKPIRWVNKFTRFHNVMLDTDEEMNVPSTTSSSSSSALSSPRPSALATTVFDVDLRNDMMFRLFPDVPNVSSLESRVVFSHNGSLHSNQGGFGGEPSLDSLPSSGTNLSSSVLGSSFGVSHGACREESERFPPPPPLPPLKWRVARATKDNKFASTPKSTSFSSPSVPMTKSSEQIQVSASENPVPRMSPEKLEQRQVLKPSTSAKRASLDNHKDSLPSADAERLAFQEGFEACDDYVKAYMKRTATGKLQMETKDLPDAGKSSSKVDYGFPNTVQDSSQVSSSLRMQTNGTVSLNASRSDRETLLSSSHGGNISIISNESMEPVTASKAGLEPMLVPTRESDSLPMPKTVKTPLFDAVASHGSETEIPQRSQSSRMAKSDERENMLEQIRTGSFNLRHVKVEKQDLIRPVTSISVAAILEKANAIRQAVNPNIDDIKDDDGWE